MTDIASRIILQDIDPGGIVSGIPERSPGYSPQADWPNQTGLPDPRSLPGGGDNGGGSTSPGCRFPWRRMICMAWKPKWRRLFQYGGMNSIWSFIAAVRPRRAIANLPITSHNEYIGYCLEMMSLPAKSKSLIIEKFETEVQTMNYGDRITLEPGKRSGKPCIRGMRITVYDVLSYLASGMTYPEILDDFPYLTQEDILACLSYAAEREHQTLLVQA